MERPVSLALSSSPLGWVCSLGTQLQTLMSNIHWIWKITHLFHCQVNFATASGKQQVPKAVAGQLRQQPLEKKMFKKWNWKRNEDLIKVLGNAIIMSYLMQLLLKKLPKCLAVNSTSQLSSPAHWTKRCLSRSWLTYLHNGAIKVFFEDENKRVTMVCRLLLVTVTF